MTTTDTQLPTVAPVGPPAEPPKPVVIDDDQGDEFELLKSGRVRLSWLTGTGVRQTVFIRRLSVGDFEHFMVQVGDLLEQGMDSSDDDLVSPKLREAADNGDQTAITIRNMKRNQRDLGRSKRIAAEVLQLSDHPELAADVDNLPAWVGAANYIGALIQHWGSSPLPSGQRPALVALPDPS